MGQDVTKDSLDYSKKYWPEYALTTFIFVNHIKNEATKAAVGTSPR